MTTPLFLLKREWRRLLFLFRRQQLQNELVQELEFHRAERAAENEREGDDPETARVGSCKQMGNVTLASEECRDVWSFMAIERLLQDARYASRLFRKAPGFTAIAVFSLALGIGGNAAMFSLVHQLLVKQLAYPAPERLVRITGIYPRAAIPFFQQRSRTMDVAAVSSGSDLNLTGQGMATRVATSTVSANFFAVLGARMERGRSFVRGEDVPGKDASVVISHALWRERFGNDDAIVGRIITLNGVNREIVGVLPEGFNYPSPRIQTWIPARLDPSNFLEYWGGEFVPFVARLRQGASLQGAQPEVRQLLAEFRKTIPYPMSRDWNADSSAIPLQEDLMGDVRGKLLLLTACVGVVLLIACTNVAGLLLTRATTRRKEIAIRSALGAGRLRLVRQLLTESVALSLGGAVIGLPFGVVALSIFKSVLPADTPGLVTASIDAQVVAAMAGLAVVTGFVFGLAPALSVSEADLARTTKTGGQRATGTIWPRLRSALIGLEVALTFLLVVSAALLLRSLTKLTDVQTGFEASHIFAMQISPTQTACKQRENCIAFYDRLLDHVRHVSGVAEAGAVNSVPLDGQVPTQPMDVEGHPRTAEHPSPMLLSYAVTPDYLRMLHIPLLAGRGLSAGDSARSSRVLLISAATARRFWPFENAIGKHMKPSGSKEWSTVVGVVADVKHYTLSTGLPSWVAGAVYMPYSQAVREDGEIPAAMTLLVKSNLVQSTLAGELAQMVREEDPNVPAGKVQPVTGIVADSVSGYRSMMAIFMAFAFAAILLAAVGIYGLVAYWVSQRAYEIGLRFAIGATRRGIISMVVGQGVRVAAYGLAIGVVAAIGLTRFLQSLLYGVGATDLGTFAGIAALILIVTTGATAVPAWRASRIDPIKTLRLD